MNDPSLRDGPDVDVGEAADVVEVGQEVLGEDLTTGRGTNAAENVELLRTESGGLHPAEHLVETGRDAVTRLVLAVVRVAPEAVVELSPPFGESHSPVELGHRQLIVVGKENSVGDAHLAKPRTPVFAHKRCVIHAFCARKRSGATSGAASGP